MAIDIKGADGIIRTFSSVDLYNKHKTQQDLSECAVQILASIGNELENISELLERELGD